MKSFLFPVIIVIAALTIVAACSPKTQTTTTPSPTSSAPISTPTSILPLSSPQDASWAKVVEAAKKEGKLTVYSYMMVGDTGLALSRAFETKYGIKVDIITGRGAEFLERLKTEKRVNQIVGDFLQTSPIHVMNIKKDGLTRSLSGIPEIQQKENFIVDPLGLDPEGHLLGLYVSIMTAYSNPNLVKPADEPKRWKDLLEPRWTGKIGITDVNIAGTAYLVFAPLMRLGYVDENFIKALGRQKLVVFSSDFDLARGLARGDVSLTASGSTSAYAPMAREGAPVKALAMEDGTTISLIPVAALKDGPHPNAGLLFANWLVSAEGQEVVSKAAAVPPVRKGVTDYTPAPVKVSPLRSVLLTNQDDETTTKWFREKYFPTLWGK